MADASQPIPPRKFCEKSEGMGLCLCYAGRHMVSINEELEAAKAAKAAINALAARKSEGLTTLKHAYRVAVLNFSGEGLLNEARGIVGIALSNVMRGLPTEEKINKAKSAIDTWINNLERSL